MIEGIFNQPNYVAAKKLLDATLVRHEAIASNLANVETPNYQRRDLAPSFRAELNRALQGQSIGQLARLTPELAIDTTAVAQNRDGNTVQMEQELMHLNQNTLAHAVESQMLTSTLMRMRLAITGRS